MRRTPQKQVPFTAWPEEDRNRWTAAFKAGDPFDDCGPAAHLADRTRQGQTTEKHYIMAQSRLAGRALARAIDGYK